MTAAQQDILARIDTALAAGAVVLVPNYRGSDQLIDDLCELRRTAGAGPVQTRPAVFAIDLWLHDLWRDLARLDDAPALQARLLSAGEEHLLWRELVESAEEFVLLNPEGAATTLASGYRLLQQWQVSLDTLRTHLALGTDAGFDDRVRALDWYRAFASRCRTDATLTFSGLVQILVTLLADGMATRHALLPRTVVLWGFDSPPPLYLALFDALRQSGTQVQELAYPASTPNVTLRRFAQPQAECLAAARWAAATASRQPDARIALVAPDSDLLKGPLARACGRVMHATPETWTNTLSAALSDHAWVHDALATLDLWHDSLPATAVLGLIRSPWLVAANEEQDARGELELRLRRPQSDTIRIAEVRRLCMQDQRAWYCPVLGQALEVIRLAQLRHGRNAPLQVWIAEFERAWQALLPRERLLERGQGAALRAFETLLRDLYRSATGPLGRAEAIRNLRAHCRHTTVALGKRQAPVSLLTPTTATGMRFTHMWCLQMTDDAWPGEQRPHPYLPLQLQRDLGMPAHSPEAALAESRAMLEHLLGQTGIDVVFSYSTVVDDLPQRPSTLLPAMAQEPAIETEGASGLHPLAVDIEPVSLDILQDEASIGVDTAVATGGASLIASQANCPFQAFARYRLGLRELPRLGFGLPPHAIGNCVHEAMQAFWNQMRDSNALATASPPVLEEHLRAALEPALTRLGRDYPDLLGPMLRGLELERLTRMLLRWLDEERRRMPFTVLATELQTPVQFDRLALDFRIDRVDVQQDGTIAIVDYKTGRKVGRDWDAPRPEASQLMLYELAWSQQPGSAPCSALLYAQIHVDAVGYLGVTAADTQGLPLAVGSLGLAFEDWEALRTHWHHVLGMLADEFLQGYAAVQPARRDSCTYCSYRPLCRIDAQPGAGA